MLADLVRRGQIEGWDPPIRFDEPAPSPGDVAATIAELINPAFGFRTLQGIAKATLLQTNVVSQAPAALPTVN